MQPTAEGSLYYQRCVSILAAREANRSAGGASPAPSGWTWRAIWREPCCCPRYRSFSPAIRPLLQIGESERDVDLVREGVDCVIRGGHLPDSEMICRPLAMLQEITCASRPTSPGTVPRIRLTGWRDT